MKRLTWIVLIVLLAVVGAVLLQRRAVLKLQRERQALRTAQQQVRQLAGTNPDSAPGRADADELQALRAVTRDLPRLRNEIRQRREQEQELIRLRAENRRLADQLKR